MVHSPDRLPRNNAYQVLLIDEWRRAGVEVAFLNRSLGQKSLEDDLLLSGARHRSREAVRRILENPV
jgi:hypothetical protein